MHGTYHGGPPPEFSFPYLDEARGAVQDGHFYDVSNPLEVANGHGHFHDVNNPLEVADGLVGQMRMTDYLPGHA